LPASIYTNRVILDISFITIVNVAVPEGSCIPWGKNKKNNHEGVPNDEDKTPIHEI